MAGEYIEFNNNTQPAVNDTNLNRLQQLIKQDIVGTIGGDTLPVGAIMPFGSDTIPENWLLCDGQAVSRSTYSDLFNTIGTTFGQGDGFTTFNLPNYKDKFTIGKDNDNTDFNTLGSTNAKVEYETTTPSNDYITGIVQNYIIKAFQSSGVVATVAQSNTSSNTDTYSCNYINNKCDGVVVYDNSTGTNGTVTFTFPTTGDSLINYSKIRIYSKIVMTGYTAYYITECEAVAGGTLALNQARLNADSLWLNDTARYTMNAGSLTKDYECDVRIAEGNVASFNKNTTRTKIYKVELIK